jgi:predicted PurR-regulated permease PerM
VNPHANPLLRFAATIVGFALGLRLAYELVAPILPALTIAFVIGSVIYFVRWLRRRGDRW